MVGFLGEVGMMLGNEKLGPDYRNGERKQMKPASKTPMKISPIRNEAKETCVVPPW